MQPPDKTINEAGEWKNASPRQIFALLIGIDKYLHCDDNIIKNLSGCNNDVDDVTDFLRTTLHVPDSNITQLRDEGATFAGITEALKGLANDIRIAKGDAIVVFYAGHGTEVWPPGGMKFGRKKVHLLAPHDFSIDLTKVSPGAKQPEYGERCNDMLANALKNGLRDIDLGQRLKKIADAKGDNITVILDCSHSARGTRDFATSSVSPRGIDLPEGPRQSHNAYVRHPRPQTPDDEENTGLTSHTLLAAASPSQHAHESANKAGLMRGVFTSHLTELLRSWHDLAQITYVDIILNLPSLPRQIPQCEGLNKYRVFLQDYLAGSQPSPIDLTYNTSTSRYILHVGDTHGVTVGTKLTVYDAPSCKNELGQVVVEEVQSIQSFIHAPDFQIPSTGAFVLWTPVRSLRVFLHPGHKIDTDFLRLFENETSAWKLSLILVDKRESSDLVISTSNRGTPCFELIDQACVAEGFHKIHDKLIPMMDEMIMRIILCGIIHFLGYLHLKPTLSHRIAAANKVEVECFELIRVSVQLNFLHLMKVPRGCNLIEDGKMTVINPSREMYGLRITNTTATPLFVFVFYFDMSDLSITTFYEPPLPGSVPCLPPGDILTVGYGTSGTQARSYFVPDGQSLDVGHVKLFLSTEYVNYHEVAQGSPFGYRHNIPVPKTTDCCWFTLDIPIIMRRE